MSQEFFRMIVEDVVERASAGGKFKCSLEVSLDLAEWIETPPPDPVLLVQVFNNLPPGSVLGRRVS